MTSSSETESPAPAEAAVAAPSLTRRELCPLTVRDPFRWLAAGWRDLLAAKGIALFYGCAFWLMALVLGAVFQHKPEYTMSFISGCFLVGPFLAMGLYEVSRRRERGLPQDLAASLTCWDKHLGSMGMLVLVVMLLELLWGRASLVVFAVFFNTGMPSTASVVQAVFNMDNWRFIAVYLAVGGAFATLVFSTCVVSIPMILDRDTDAITAGIASIHMVLGDPAVLSLWGLLIVVLVVTALMLPWGIGLLLVGPWLGHASWHAYKGAFRWVEVPAEAAAS